MSKQNLSQRRRTSTVFEKTSVLADILEDITYAYTGERESVRVNTGTRSAANMRTSSFHVTTNIREEVGRPLDGPNKLRYIIDDLAHAIEHDRVTDFNALENFVAEYEDDGEAEVVLAALVVTTLEDQFVDTSLLQSHRGHRRSVAFKHAVQMRSILRPPLSDLEPEPALVEGYIQLATAGYVKDAEAVSTRRQVLLRWMRKKINEARYADDQQERINIAQEITDYLIEHTSTNHTAAKSHVFNNPPPTHDLDPILDKLGVEQTQDSKASELMNKLKSKLSRARQKAGGNRTPKELPDDVDMEDVEQDEELDVTPQMPEQDNDNEEAESRSVRQEETEDKEPASEENASEEEQDDKENEPQPSAGESEQQPREDANEKPSAGKQEEYHSDDKEDDSLSDSFHDEDDVGDLSSSKDTPDVGTHRGSRTSVQDNEGKSATVGKKNRDAKTAGDGTEQSKSGAPTQQGQSDNTAGGGATGSDTQEDSLSDSLEAGDAGDWYGNGSEGDDYLTPTDRAKERFEALKRAVIKEKMGELGERREKRDKRIRSSGGITHDIQGEVNKRGLVEEVVETFYRLKTRDRDTRSTKGRRLNERAVVRNLSGNFAEQKLYFKRQRAETGDRAVGVAVDLSGSMDAVETMVALGTLAEAVDIIGDELVITTFHSHDSAMITGPEEEFDWSHFKAARAGGSTPTAHGVLDSQLLLDEVTKREKVLFVITDGKPNVGLEQTRRNALEDAKAQVKRARHDNVKVIGLGLSGMNEQNMKTMFGKDNYVMVNDNRLAEDLLTVYRNQMSTPRRSYR